MGKIKKLFIVWGSGILGFFMLYFITGGKIEGVNIGAGKVCAIIIIGMIYGTFKVLFPKVEKHLTKKPTAKKPTAKKIITKKPTVKKKPSKPEIYLPYTPEQKKVLLKTYVIATKQQRNSIISLFFSIISAKSPTKNDFEKIERCCDLFNVKIELALSKYSGWDGVVKDLNPLPKRLKEFLVIESMEYMFINDKFSPERMQQAAKIFEQIGISENKALEILAKHKANKDIFI